MKRGRESVHTDIAEAGYTTLSSIFYVLLVDIALVAFFYLKPDPALNSTNMTILDLFIAAVLIGGMTLPKGLIPFTGIIQIILINAIFFLRPHSANTKLSKAFYDEGDSLTDSSFWPEASD